MRQRGIEVKEGSGSRGYRRRDSRGLTVWDRVVIKAEQQGVSPDCLVSVLFGMWDGRKPPLPAFLIGRNVLANIQTYDIDKRHEAAMRLLSDNAAMQVALYDPLIEGLSEYKKYNAILANGLLQMSPLFRYCVATQLDLPDIRKTYRKPADLQFYEYPPAYLDKWRKLLPPRYSRHSN